MNENIDIKTERYVVFSVAKFNELVDFTLPTVLTTKKTKGNGIPYVCNVIKIEMSRNHIATLRGANCGWISVSPTE
jgi:hypothetical protein